MQKDELQSISPRYRGRPTNIHCDIGQKRVYRKINGEKKPTCVEQTEVRKKCPTGKIKHEGECIKKEDKPTGRTRRGRPPACDEGKKRVYRKVDGVKTRTCVNPTEVRKKCPKGKITYNDECIKKEDKTKGTRGRPKKQPLLTKNTIQKKTQMVDKAQAEAQKKRKEQEQAEAQKKRKEQEQAAAKKKQKEQAQAQAAQKKRKEQAQAAAQKKRKEQAQAAQKKRKEQAQQKRLKLNAKEYDKVVEEIEKFYLETFDNSNQLTYSLDNYDEFVIDDDDIRYMPSFMKFSGITKEEAKKIIKESRTLYKKLKYDVCDANAFILNNILLGKAYDYSDPYAKLPIEVLLGTIIHDTSDKDAWEWDTVDYGDGYNYENVISPKFINQESPYAIKSFNEKRYNKFLDLMKEKGVKF